MKRLMVWGAVFLAAFSGGARAADQPVTDAFGDTADWAKPAWAKEKEDKWPGLKEMLFGNREIADAKDVLTLETPYRALNSAIMPLTITALKPQSKDRYIKTITVVIEENPSPVAAVFNLTPENGLGSISTRVRIDRYTNLRAIAETSDGKLYMATNFVKAAGGCSAPAGRDAAAARANLGKMRLRVLGAPEPGRPLPAQLMIGHPNESGLAMDQLTRTYAPPHFVRHIEVRHAGKQVLSAEVDFSISENPNFRFYFMPSEGGELEAKAVDNLDLQFETRMTLDRSRSR